IEIYEMTENLKQAFTNAMITLYKDPVQFVKDVDNMPMAMLAGMKQQFMDIANKAADYYDAVEQGRYRQAARILAKHVTLAAVQVAASELGSELLYTAKASSFALQAEVKAVSRFEGKVVASAEKTVIHHVDDVPTARIRGSKGPASVKSPVKDTTQWGLRGARQ